MITKNLIIFVITLLLSSIATAEDRNVYTYGDVHSRVLVKIFFPDAPAIAAPGADGLLVWKKLEGSKTDMAIQLSIAVHFLPHLHPQENFAGKYELLATLATSQQALFVSPNFPAKNIQDLKQLNRPITVGWIGHACKAFISEVFAKHNVEFIYVAYKTAPEAMTAMIGGHIDATCPAGSFFEQTIRNKTGRIIFNITEHYKFLITTYLFVNRDMSQVNKNKIIQQLTKPLTVDDVNSVKESGFELYVKTGESAADVYRKNQKIWQTVIQKQDLP